MMKGYKKVMDFIAGLEKTPSPFLVFYRGVGGGSVCIDYPCGSSFGLPRRRTGKSASAYRPVTKEKQKTSCCDDYRAVCGIYSGAVSVWF